MEGSEFISANYIAIFIKTMWNSFGFHVCRLAWTLNLEREHFIGQYGNLFLANALKTSLKRRRQTFSSADSAKAGWHIKHSLQCRVGSIIEFIVFACTKSNKNLNENYKLIKAFSWNTSLEKMATFLFIENGLDGIASSKRQAASTHERNRSWR